MRPRKMLVVLLSAGLSALAHAAPRTFVASHGTDANSCSVASPCRGFTRALTQTDVGGEIIVLDSAGYGAVAIRRRDVRPDGTAEVNRG